MKKGNKLTDYEYDNIWMSLRYCIGRHTIASYSHAKDIACIEYKRLSNEQKQHISKLINEEIYDVLSMSLNFRIENRYIVPSVEFRPLDLYYQALQSLKINNLSDFKTIHNIAGTYNVDEKKWYFECCKQPTFKNDIYKSTLDLKDLEVWQCLANLFDVENYKSVIYNNEEIVYYETMTLKGEYENVWDIKKIKRPIDSGYTLDSVSLNEKIFSMKELMVQKNRIT